MAEKLVFLYAGIDGNGNQYKTYSEADINKFTNSNEFVIANGNYSHYLDNCTATSLGSNAQSLIANMLDLAYTIWQTCGKNVWFGLPHVPTATQAMTVSQYASGTNSYSKRMNYFIDSLKTQFNARFNNSFNAHVRGFYMNHEHVSSNMDPAVGEGFPFPMNYNNLTLHPEVAMFDSVSQHVHAMSRALIWAPYYGCGATVLSTIEDIGYIANRSNIFDFVFLQPQYYFYDEVGRRANLEAIRESIRLNRVTYRNNGDNTFGVVSGGKNSNTMIGCQMEIDQYCNSGTRPAVTDIVDSVNFEILQTRFKAYTDCFNNISNPRPSYNKANYPFSFYLGGKFDENGENVKDWTNVTAKVDLFFK